MDDCRLDTFTCGGHGGSGKDTSNTGVRIVHLASGASGECREERSQLSNKRRAFRRMAEDPKFLAWVHRRAAQLAGRPSVDARVDADLAECNLRIEVKDEQGHWMAAPSELQ